MNTPLTPAQAWSDFIEKVLPSIWGGLTDKQKNTIITARRDASGIRIRPNGKKYALGADRIEKLLTTYAPGRYRFEKTVVVYIQE